MTMQLRKASRKQAKIKIGVFGPSGSGKTMSALKMARGLTKDWNKIAIIDTENKSADLYSDLGDYNVITLEAPFTPEKYIEAIEACEKAGIEVIIIDSITHEWAGSGGILELADALGAGAKNSFSVWGKLTPRHNKFIDAILQSSANVICCGRSKQDYVLNQVEKNGKTINVPEKVGLKSITREGFDYEMTVSFDIAISHYASTTKDRTKLFDGKPEFIISEKTGELIKKWNAEGVIDHSATKKLIIEEMMRIKHIPKKSLLEYPFADVIKGMVGIDLKEENFDKIYLILKEQKEEGGDEISAEELAKIGEEENFFDSDVEKEEGDESDDDELDEEIEKEMKKVNPIKKVVSSKPTKKTKAKQPAC
ncbi:MAG: AAA family ATPase [Candidatus Paceibacterota bacterium]